MHPVKSAVIGLGSMGTYYHAETLHRLPEFELTGAADTSEARLQEAHERYGCRGYTDYAQMLTDPELELVCVATPSSMHRDNAIGALEAGKHCIVEKPLCLNLREFDDMVAAATANGRILCAYQNRRWDEGALTIQSVVDSGVLGELFFIESIGGGFSRIMLEYGVKEFQPDWRGMKKYGGGVLYDFGAHSIDQVLCWMHHAPIKDVYADLHGHYWTQEVDDTCLLVIRFENGVTATISSSTAARAAVCGCAIVGRDAAYKDGKIYSGEPNALVETEPEKVTGSWDDYYRQMYRTIREGAPQPIPLQQTRMLIQIFDAAFESSATGQVVQVGR